jgi:hypothetical protein
MSDVEREAKAYRAREDRRGRLRDAITLFAALLYALCLMIF